MQKNVEVRVRIRPLKVPDGPTSRLVVDPGQRRIVIGDKSQSFEFDRVHVDEPQEALYESVVSGLVDGVLDGFNATVFAYGQSASGKTFTMGVGDDDEVGDEEETEGIVPRAARDLLAKGARSGIGVAVTYVEIYNEEIRDLLVSSKAAACSSLAVRETAAGDVSVVGAVESTVESAEDVARLMRVGARHRAVGGTALNDRSSRSHAILTLTTSKTQRVAEHFDSGSQQLAVVRSKLHCVDLAGSERQKRANNNAERMKEGIAINQGLLALAKVISALCDKATASSNTKAPQRRAQRQTQFHVPYRDSKLTRLLQDSLGGNARTVMIACVSPDAADVEETTQTLSYAARARKICNTVVANAAVLVGASETESRLRRALAEARQLRDRVAQLENKNNNSNNNINKNSNNNNNNNNNNETNGPPSSTRLPPPSPPPSLSGPTTAAAQNQSGSNHLESALLEANGRLLEMRAACEGLAANAATGPKTRRALGDLVEASKRRSEPHMTTELLSGGAVAAAYRLQGLVAAESKERRRLEKELEEAKADLLRDEELFAYRDAAAKSARSRAEAADAACVAMREEIESMAAAQEKIADATITSGGGDNADAVRLRLSEARSSAQRARRSAAALDASRSAQLEALEREIQLKEACIASLAASEEEANRAVRRYEARVRDLERERHTLRDTACFELEQLRLQRRSNGPLRDVERLAEMSDVRARELEVEVNALRAERDALKNTNNNNNNNNNNTGDPPSKKTTTTTTTSSPSSHRRRTANKDNGGGGQVDDTKTTAKAARWLKRRLDGIVGAARDRAALSAALGKHRELERSSPAGAAAAKVALVPEEGARLLVEREVALRKTQCASPMPDLYSALAALGDDLRAMPADLASAALLETCRQVVALRLARDDDVAALKESRRLAQHHRNEHKALQATLDDGPPAEIKAEASVPLTELARDEYETKIAYLLKELRNHEAASSSSTRPPSTKSTGPRPIDIFT